MSKRSRKKTYRLSAIREAAAGTGGEAVELEMDNGETFDIPTPKFWDDAVFERFNAQDLVGAAKILLGDRYEAFRAAGGRAVDIDMIFEEHSREQGATLPESAPSPVS